MRPAKGRGDPKVFARNLRLLTEMWDLSQKAAAQQISRTHSVRISYSWYRMLCTRGIAQQHERSKVRLSAIASFFTVISVENLWDDDLIRLNLSHRVLPPSHHAVYPVRLVQLLETGRHDYLRELVTRLHELEFSLGKSDSHGTAESEDDGDVEPEIIDDRHRRGKLDLEDED